jgi:hypothetical protein
MGFLANLVESIADQRSLAFRRWEKSRYQNQDALRQFLDACEQMQKLQQRINQLDRRG